jgi:hypothetical protein
MHCVQHGGRKAVILRVGGWTPRKKKGTPGVT